MDRFQVLNFFEQNKEFYSTTVSSNIERYRKGNCKVTVLDKNGAKLKNVKVNITQKSHAFRFGANLFMLDELETEEKNCLYKKYFKDAFNMATLPFYWKSTEPQPNELRFDKGCSRYYRRPSIDLCIEFCKENGIEPREHALAYEQHFPNWLKDKSVDEVKALLEKRYQEISQRYGDKINTIEVTNEMFWWHGVTPFYDEDDYVEWCFKLAEKYFPNNQLVVNEATEECWCEVRRSTNKYYSYIKNALLCGAKIDAIGMQFHMFYSREQEKEKSQSFYNPQNLYNYLDFFSKLVDTLQITEITVPAYSEKDEDEEIQAKIIENLYRLWFSHPCVEQIIYWNLVDGYAYVHDPTPEKIARTQGDMSVGENVYYGGLLRFDLTPKPAYQVIKHLITKEWHTSLESLTNSEGSVDFRGFYGDYQIEIDTENGIVTREFSIVKNGESNITISL